MKPDAIILNDDPFDPIRRGLDKICYAVADMFRDVDPDSLALLRALKGHDDQHNPGVPLVEGIRLAPELVAERAGLDPDTLRYERAVRHS